MTYEVIVGNIGRVYIGTSPHIALKTYKEYREQSERGIGLAGGEDVALLEDGEIKFLANIKINRKK